MATLTEKVKRMGLIRISKNDLQPRILSELEGREAYTDIDNPTENRIFEGDVFDAILGELGELEDTPMAATAAAMEQLVELSELSCEDFVLISEN
jgi:hypothetical protein